MSKNKKIFGLTKRNFFLLIIGLIIHSIFFYSLPTGLINPFFHDATRDYKNGFDFFSIYQAGYNFLHNLSVYYGVRVHKFGKKYQVVPYFSGFRYLPIYAYLYGTLLNIFSPWTSYWIWVMIEELLLIIMIFLTFKLCKKDLNKFIPIFFMIVTFSPYYLELFMGQQSFVTSFLLFLMGYAIFQNREKLFNGAYIFSAVWKLNTLILLPLFIRLKRFKTLLILLLIIIITSLPYFIIVKGSFSEFISYFKVKFIADGPNSLGLWALVISSAKKLGYVTNLVKFMQIVSYMLVIIAGIITFLNKKVDIINLMVIWFSLYFLIYKYVWEHHYVMLLPLLVILFIKGYKKVSTIVWFFTAIPTPFIIFNVPGQNMPQQFWSFWQTFIHHSIKVIPVIILFLYMIIIEILRAFKEKDLLVLYFINKIRK